MNKKRWCGVLSACTLILMSPFAAMAADHWPSRPIRLLLPVAVGGTADASARIIQKPLSEALGQQVIIENRPGGMGTISTDAVVRAEPDGYVLGLVNTQHPATPFMLKKMSYDIDDLVPVAFFWRAVLALTASKSSGISTLDDLVARARAKPGLISYASGGVGQGSHFAVELLQANAGIQVEHVPYRGAALGLNDVVAGHVPLLTSGAATVRPFVEKGLLTVLAVTPSASVSLPGAKTFAQQGFPDVDIAEWYGVVGPKGLPPDIVSKLNTAITQVMARADVQEQFRQLDLEYQPMTPTEFAAYLAKEKRRMQELIKKNHIVAQ